MTTPGYVQPNAYGPVTPTQMFERTMTLLRENFKLFFGIVLVAVGVEVVVGTVLGLSEFWMRHSSNGADGMMKVLLLSPLVLLGAALVYIFAQIIQGALFYATQAKLTDASMTVGEACKLAADKVGKIIGISLLVALRILGYIVLFYIAFIFLAFMVALGFGGLASISGQNLIRSVAAQSIGVYVLIGILGLLFLVFYLGYLLWLVARYAASIPACLAENLPITEAIHRSVRLSARSRGRIYALFLVVGGVWIAITLITLPLQFLAVHAARSHHAITPIMVGIFSLCIAGFKILVSAFLVAFMGVAITLCYFDLRVRKERFGVVLQPPASEPDPIILPPAPELQSPGMPTEDFPAS